MTEVPSENVRAPHPDTAELDTNQDIPDQDPIPHLRHPHCLCPQTNNTVNFSDTCADSDLARHDPHFGDLVELQPGPQQLIQQAVSAGNHENEMIKQEYAEDHHTSNGINESLPYDRETHSTTSVQKSATPLTTSAGEFMLANADCQDARAATDLRHNQSLTADKDMIGDADNYSDDSLEMPEQDSELSVADSDEQRIQAYAKLEFDDGEFYMTTYAVELGRDIVAARQAFDRGLDFRDGTSSRSGQNDASNESFSILEHIISQGDGCVRPIDISSETRGVDLKRKRSRSSGSASQRLSQSSSVPHRVTRVDYNDLAMQGLSGHLGMNGYGPEFTPSPSMMPLIPIHPPTFMDGAGAHKSISRRHIKIAFNFEKHLFEATVLGRNGCYVNDEFVYPEDVRELHNGSILQIGGVGVRFVLPDVPEGATGAELRESSDPLSGGIGFGMANSDAEDLEREDVGNEEEQDLEEEDDGQGMEQIEPTEDEDEEEEEEEEPEPKVVLTKGKTKKKLEPPPPPAKRKGPGRPPKNGVSSKREQALQAKEAREEAKSQIRKASGIVEERGKRKIAKEEKVRKQAELQPNGKRKYTKRKRTGGLEDQQRMREDTEKTESAPPEQALAAALPPKPPKEKKPVKPPRSPSPVFDESTMTPEQLAKPQSSYVVLIYEALKNSATGAMSLPQIYRAIERKYPFYKLRVQTQGWQSSVRHNLSQHGAFKKIQRNGKGWMWGLVPDVAIDKEKKRRISPPITVPQGYYQNGPSVMQHPSGYASMPGQYGHVPQGPYGTSMHFPPPYSRPPIPLPLATAESAYQSPYQSAPPPVSHPTSQLQIQLSNGTGPYPQSYAPSKTPHPQTFNNSGVPSAHQEHVQVPSAVNGAATIGEPSQEVARAVASFKSSLIGSIEDKAHAEALVTSAINRTLGIQKKSSVPGEEDPKEKSIMTAFSTMLEDISKKNMAAKHQAPIASEPLQPTSSHTELVEEESSQQPNGTSKPAEVAIKITLANGDINPSRSGEIDTLQVGTESPVKNGDMALNNRNGEPVP